MSLKKRLWHRGTVQESLAEDYDLVVVDDKKWREARKREPLGLSLGR